MSLATGKFRELAEHNDFFAQHGIRVRITGEKSLLRDDVQKAMIEVEELTADNKNCTLNVCMAYGGLEEISHAINTT